MFIPYTMYVAVKEEGKERKKVVQMWKRGK